MIHEIVRAVIEYEADVDAEDLHRDTALYVAALQNKVEAIDVLVEAGASIKHGMCMATPLRRACIKLNREALLCLLKHLCDH